MSRTDAELLRRFGELDDHEAFAELTRRHLPSVHGAALRQVGDSHLAKDVAQVVFARLALRWNRLPAGVILAGWLHADTRLVSLQLLRTERRRRERDRKAMADHPPDSQPPNDPDWSAIRPLIDSALARLGARDRDALLLRFFEQRSLREVGEAIGVAEDAARMRIGRALETLRDILRSRGVSTTSGALATALTAHAAPPVLPGIAEAVVSAALSASAAATLSPATLTLTTALAMSKTATVVATLAVAALLAVPLVRQYSVNRELRAENQGLRTAVEELQVRAGDEAGQLETLRADFQDLNKRLAELPILRAELDRARRTAAAPPRAQALETQRNVAPAAAIEVTPGEVEQFLRLPRDEQARQLAASRRIGVNASDEVGQQFARAREMASKVRESLEGLENQPADFAAFQSAFVGDVASIQDPQRVGQIREIVRQTYDQAVRDGLVASSRPAADFEAWARRRDALDRAATREVQALLPPDERERFDRYFLGIMGVDLGIGDGTWHRFVLPGGGVVFPSEQGPPPEPAPGPAAGPAGSNAQ